MSGKRLNFKLLGVFLSLVSLSMFLVANKEQSMVSIKLFLEWKHLSISLWFFYICCFSVHYLSIKDDQSYDSGLIYKHFGKFADSGFAVGTYGLASTTSAAILKGVYSQQFFQEEIYFTNFDQIDIYSMLVVCLFLFGYSVYAAMSALINAMVISQSEMAIPVTD